MTAVSTVGTWRVHSGTVVTPDGATTVTVISDGHSEWHSPENTAELVVALMQHLGIASITAADEPA